MNVGDGKMLGEKMILLLRLLKLVKSYFYSLCLLATILVIVIVSFLYRVTTDELEEVFVERVCKAKNNVDEKVLLCELESEYGISEKILGQDVDFARLQNVSFWKTRCCAARQESEVLKFARLINCKREKVEYNRIGLKNGTELCYFDIRARHACASVLIFFKTCSRWEITIREPHQWIDDRMVVVFDSLWWYGSDDWNRLLEDEDNVFGMWSIYDNFEFLDIRQLLRERHIYSLKQNHRYRYSWYRSIEKFLGF